MPNKHPISNGGSNIIRPVNYISFWEKGEMPYTAIKRINELKVKNEWEKAQIILSDWIL